MPRSDTQLWEFCAGRIDGDHQPCAERNHWNGGVVVEQPRLQGEAGRLLQAGVLSSAFCLAAGLALWMLRGPSPLSSRALTVGQRAAYGGTGPMSAETAGGD